MDHEVLMSANSYGAPSQIPLLARR
jgi:hypothetical protein